MILTAALAAPGLAQQPPPTPPEPRPTPTEPRPSGSGAADQPDAAKKAADNKEEIEQGIPVTSELVRNTCSPCHKVDEKQRVTRISFRRTTPDGWEETIKRMGSLNGRPLEPATERQIRRSPPHTQALSPDPAKSPAFAGHL